MSGIDRRRFITGAAATGGAALATRVSPAGAAEVTAAARGGQRPDDSTGFEHGVASGDPGPDRVVLWTRVGGVTGDVDVAYEVYADPDATALVASGSARAASSADHTVHVDVEGLEPGTAYWYRFMAGAASSPVGRTRTLPAAGASDVRIGVVSCARLPSGSYAAYAALADEDVDVVIHLGDYIYEDGRDGLRPHVPPRETTTLSDYRARYAQYRSDPDLQRLHASHPMIAVWDDHEFANNCWRDGARDREAGWPDRRAAAAQAWWEWLPARLPDAADPLRVWRSFELGDLVSVSCLDTRVWGRDRQATTPAAIEDPERSLLGTGQRDWLLERLSRPAPWRVMANQVMMAPLAIPRLGGTIDDLLAERGLVFRGDDALNPDQWDGYEAERSGVLAAAAAGPGAIVLTGDLHSSWVSELAGPDPDAPPAAVEFVGPSVTSASFGSSFGSLAGAAAELLQRTNPGLRHVDLVRHGYMVAVFVPETVTVAYRYVDPISEQDATVSTGSVFAVDRVTMTVHPPEGGRPAPRPLPTLGERGDPATAGGSEADGDGGGSSDVALVAAAVAGTVGVGAVALAAARRHGGAGADGADGADG